jgi:hypothetical protein
MDTFGKGWAKGDIALILTVFSPNAILIETPFSEPHRGLELLRLYWRDVAYHQSEITFTTGEIYAAGPWFSTEFKLLFRRKRTGEWVEARGAIFCETDGREIIEMRMYWHRWNGGKETSKP